MHVRRLVTTMAVAVVFALGWAGTALGTEAATVLAGALEDKKARNTMSIATRASASMMYSFFLSSVPTFIVSSECVGRYRASCQAELRLLPVLAARSGPRYR